MTRQVLGRRTLSVFCLASMLVASLTLFAVSTGNATADDRTISVGIDLPLSFGDAAQGQNALNGMLLAIKEANAQGLPGGFTLKPVVLDDVAGGLHSAEKGAANAKTLVANPNVLVMVGPFNSNVAQAEIPITNAAGLGEIAPNATNDALTIGPDAKALRSANPATNTFFRVCATDARQGSAAAFFALARMYYKAYVIDDGGVYGVGLVKVFADSYRASGGEVAGHVTVPTDSNAMKSLITQIAAAKPDVIYFGGSTASGGSLVRQQLVDAGLGKIPFMGGDGIADLPNALGADASGIYYTVPSANAEALPTARNYLLAYSAAYHEPIGPYSAGGYSAALIAIDAIKAAIASNGNALPSRAQVLSQLQQTKGAQTPIGVITFDPNGDVYKPTVSFYGIMGGKASYIDQVNVDH